MASRIDNKSPLDLSVTNVLQGGADAASAARANNDVGGQGQNQIGNILQNLLGTAFKAVLGGLLGGL